MRPVLPLLVLTTLQIINCDRDYVQVTSNLASNQLLYSSTLQWTSIQPGQALPEYSVMGANSSTEETDPEAAGKAFVCRLKNDGMWLLGQARTTGKDLGICVAVMHEQISRRESFEILENVENGGRLSWARWDKYSRIPPGTVTGDTKSYIARRSSASSKEYSHQLGKLDPDGLGHITVISDNEAEDFEDGEVLVETEPVSYQMKRVKFNLWRKRVTSEPIVLGTAKLTNEDEPTEGISRVDTVIAYK